jgi:nucleotide-binding universal stress UspA family protein
MYNALRAPVVVGVDGSPESRAAVDIGAWEAHRRRLPLRLVHGHQPPVMYGPSVTIAYDPATPLRQAGELVHTEAARVHARYPDLTTTTAVTVAEPGGVLVEESRTAALVVLGSRGVSSFYSMLLGSVSARVATHAQAPVIVVRSAAADADERRRAGVVVGVDGSPGSAAAVEFAFDEASARDTGMTAVYAWTVPPTHNLGPITESYYDPVDAQQEADRVLAEALAGWQEKFPEVSVVREALHSLNPLRTLIEESADAELVVVGARGRGGFASLLLGSVSDGLVRHAQVPVAVVHSHG